MAASHTSTTAPSVPMPRTRCLAQVLVGGQEQLEEAEHEVAVMRQLRHPNLLPLLDAATVEEQLPGGGTRQALLMLFPAFQGGSLAEVVAARAAAGAPLPLRDVLSIFVQVGAGCSEPRMCAGCGVHGGAACVLVVPAPPHQACRFVTSVAFSSHPPPTHALAWQVCGGLQAMHERALAHRDVKPHNVLLRPPAADAGAGSRTAAAAAAPALDAPELHGGQWEAVLTDFGSTRPAHVVVRNRAEAVAVQEDAEVGGEGGRCWGGGGGGLSVGGCRGGEGRSTRAADALPVRPTPLTLTLALPPLDAWALGLDLPVPTPPTSLLARLQRCCSAKP